VKSIFFLSSRVMSNYAFATL